MQAALYDDKDVELHVDDADPVIVATRVSRAMPHFHGRIVVHARTQPDKHSLYTIFQVVSAGRVRLAFVSAGGEDFGA